MSWQRVDLTLPEYAKPSEPPSTHILYPGKRHALSGPPEAAKTLFAILLGLEHRRGGHGEFAVIDFEQGEHATRLLLEELGATPEEIAAMHYYLADGPPDDTIIDTIQADGVTLVIIDALAGAYDSSGLDEYKRGDAERFSRLWIAPLWKRGIATLALDHVVKNADSRGRWAIGSERKLGTVDVHIGLEAVVPLTRGSRGVVRLTTHKDRPAHLQRPHPAELHLASDPDTHHITWQLRPVENGEEHDLPPAARKLLEALDAIGGDDGASGPALVDWIKEHHGHGLKRETVSRTLNALERDAHVRRLNPDAPPGTAAVWQRVTAVTSRVTSHHDEARVTAVTVPLYGHAARSHVAVTHNGSHADDLEEPPPLLDDDLARTLAEELQW